MTDDNQPENAPDLTKVGFYIEVEAESERELADKLYGYDDLEAMAELVGADIERVIDEYTDDPHTVLDRWMMEDGYSHEDRRELQAEQETVNDLLRNARIDGCPVLFKTDGSNLGYPTGDYTEIPHFGHSATCDDPDSCWDAPDAGGVYRVFNSANLIVAGDLDLASAGTYKLRDDVQIHVSSVTKPGVGTDDATPIR